MASLSTWAFLAVVLATCVALMVPGGEGASRKKRKGKKKQETQYAEEHLFCSSGKASYGLSVGTPSEVEWEEEAGEAPFSICLFCSSATDKDDQFVQEVCTSYGDARRSTLVQKFECVRGEFLRGFTGANSSAESSPLDSRLRCRVPRKRDKKKKDSTYQVAFPRNRQNVRRARNNWKAWDQLAMDCKQRDTYICGMKIKKPVDEGEAPLVEPLCCDVGYEKSGKVAKFKSAEASFLGVGTGKAAVAVLACFVVILALILVLCMVNVWCCRFLPTECSPHSDVEAYNNRKGSAAPQSTFNTRPNTVKPASGNGGRSNGRNNGHVSSVDIGDEEGGEENGNGNKNGKVKRPTTSTIRRGGEEQGK